VVVVQHRVDRIPGEEHEQMRGGGRWLLVVVVGSWSLGGAEGGEAPTGGGGFSEGRKGRHRLKDGTFDADSRAARA
jgi:hypothetical protein